MIRAATFLLFTCLSTPALAQRTTANAVTSSEDAFGRAVGNERIGIYSPEDVRGFNPVEAGNARIEGLYFDQVSLPTNRLIDSSSIRVGYAAQAWPFPSPTGILNLQIEKFDGDTVLSLEGEADADGNYATTVQTKLPVAGDKLGLSLGVGTRHARITSGRYIDFVGQAANLTWRPIDGAEINMFWSHFRASHTGGTPILFPGGAFTPPEIERRDYIGQDWAHGRAHNYTLGVTAKVPLGNWHAEFGLFRSIGDIRRNFADLAIGVGIDGIVAQERIIAEHDQYAGSTSGEVRLVRTFQTGALQHRLTAMLRGRQQVRNYGGQASIGLGTTSLFNRVAVPQPAIIFGLLNQSHVRHFTAGLAYEVANTQGLRLGASLQRGDYRKQIDFGNPSLADSSTRDKPWLITANATLPVLPGLRLYGGYVQGLEESPVAPDIATNSSEAPPAGRTRQMDFGFRYAVASHLALIAGLFEIRKPYYNLDAARRYGVLGGITNRGVEISLAGSLAPGLTLVSGALLLDPVLNGAEVDAGRIGRRPVGAPRRRLIVNLDWRPGGTLPWSFDLAVDANAGVAGNAANTFTSPSREQFSLGVRYRFALGGAKWLARGQITNIFNDYGWRVTSSGGFLFTGPRAFTITLSTDI